MPTIGLTSFLGILDKGAHQKSREYEKYLTPGGYDFYWQLKDAAFDYTIGGKSFDDCVEQLKNIKREVERNHNLHGFKSLHKWLSKKKYTFFEPPHSTYSSPKGYLTLKLEPEFGFEENGKRHIVQIWNCKGTELKSNIAGVGIHLLRQHLSIGEFSDCACVILDLRKLKMFHNPAIRADISAIVSSEFAWVDSFFEHHAKAA